MDKPVVKTNQAPQLVWKSSLQLSMLVYRFTVNFNNMASIKCMDRVYVIITMSRLPAIFRVVSK